MAYDLVIRGGTVVDGSGQPGYKADVGVTAGKIAAIGAITERGAEEIDAAGCIVTPGFIDAHTHMDAQIHWDPIGTSSCWHGVTTVVMGNCGFTLAPARAEQRGLVVRNLERAEDMSPEVLAAGVKWDWETFPEYMNTLERLPKGINYATYIGHSALRTWAMGERAFTAEATPAELTAMKQQLTDAIRAGAVGLSTSRSHQHETSDDKKVASRLASWEEIQQLVGTLSELGAGVFEIAQEQNARVPDPALRAEFFARMKDLAVKSRVPTTFSVLVSTKTRDAWQDQLALLDAVAAAGGRMIGQTNTRGGVVILLSFLTQLPFDRLPEWKALRDKPVTEQKKLLRDPAVRQQLVHAAHHGQYGRAIGAEAQKPNYDMVYVFDKPLPPYKTLAQVATERGVDPVEAMIDLALEADFERYFIQYGLPMAEADVLEAMRHPHCVMTFSDSGAHVSQIADFAVHTQLLAEWVKDKQAMPVEEAVNKITRSLAEAWGFTDRGLLQPGYVADINVIDMNTISPGMPKLLHDLPAGGRRLVQKPEGYRATIIAGQVFMRNGEHTGALPGKLLRGPLATTAA
jgi:N-acyl-D-aspartate/D-glutamate deacylase